MEPININQFTNVLAASSASASKTLSDDIYNQAYISIYNKGPNDAFVSTSVGAATDVFPTTTTGQAGTVIPAGAVGSFRKNADHRVVTAICAAGETATLYIQVGTGV